MNADAILREVLPPTLHTTVGWTNEILPSNQYATQVFRSGNNQIHQYRSNVVHSGVNRIQRNRTNFVQQPKLNEQEIIRRVEHGQIPPVIVRKQLPNNLVTYQQNISVRYLQPPPLPPPGPLIIREVRPPPPAPLPPIQIKQHPRRPATPPPLVLRERPPPEPAALPAKVVQKVLPQTPAGPRQVVIERYGAPPAKPRDVIFERWLPYKKPPPRKVVVERAPPVMATAKERNVLILYDGPQAQIQRKFIHQGVIRADPEEYIHRYGTELDRHVVDSHLIDEATRALPPPPIPVEPPTPPPPPAPASIRVPTPPPIPAASAPIRLPTPPPIRSPSPRVIRDDIDVHYHSLARPLTPPISYISTNRWDRIRELPRSRSYHYDYPRYAAEPPPYYYYSRPRYYENYRSAINVTPTWDRYCGSSSSYRHYPSEVIRVRSEYDFHRVMDELTDGRRPSRYYYSSSYPYYDRHRYYHYYY